MVDRILNGDAGAFKQLVKDHERLVGQVVYRMISGESDREDLCQDIFVKVYQNLDTFRFDSKLSTWITRIAYTTCLNHLEKKKVPLFEDCSPEGSTVDDCRSESGDPEQWTGSRQASVRICEEIDQLPVVYGTILSLFHLQEMSYDEIGQILNLPEGTVKSYLFRAWTRKSMSTIARSVAGNWTSIGNSTASWGSRRKSDYRGTSPPA
jgi:RNA polymerase sigma factor (sigma-70 family)